MAFFVHNICMIYLFGVIAGMLNGIFASGAGQILVFIFIYILLIQTHKARATSIFCVGLIALITIFRYITFVKIKIYQAILVVVVGLIFGVIGTKIMKKIPAKILNIVSGIVICIFSLYSIFM